MLAELAAGPPSSIALYWATSSPWRPASARITSFQATIGSSAPVSSKRIVGGTRNQSFPVASAYTISEVPIPVPAAASAPCVVVCESVPTTSAPGVMWPRSGRSWWQIPAPAS